MSILTDTDRKEMDAILNPGEKQPSLLTDQDRMEMDAIVNPSTAGDEIATFAKQGLMGIADVGTGIGQIIESVPRAIGLDNPVTRTIGGGIRNIYSEAERKIEESIPQNQKTKPIFSPDAKLFSPETWKVNPDARIRDVIQQLPRQAAQFLPGLVTGEALGPGTSLFKRMVVQGGVGALQSGGMNSAQAYVEAINTPDEIIATSPEYQELRKSMGHIEAKTKLAEDIADKVLLKTAPSGFLAGLVEFGLPGAFKGKTPIRMAKNAITDAVAEVPTEVYEQYATNIEGARANPLVDPQTGLLDSALLAAITGGGLGMVTAADGNVTKSITDDVTGNVPGEQPPLASMYDTREKQGPGPASIWPGPQEPQGPGAPPVSELPGTSPDAAIVSGNRTYEGQPVPEQGIAAVPRRVEAPVIEAEYSPVTGEPINPPTQRLTSGRPALPSPSGVVVAPPSGGSPISPPAAPRGIADIPRQKALAQQAVTGIPLDLTNLPIVRELISKRPVEQKSLPSPVAQETSPSSGAGPIEQAPPPTSLRTERPLEPVIETQSKPITEVSDDRQNITGMAGTERIGQESIQAEPVQRAGGEEAGPGGNVQAYRVDNGLQKEVNVDTFSLDSIPSGMEVDMKVILGKTGNEATIKGDAKQALIDIEQRLNKYNALLECL